MILFSVPLGTTMRVPGKQCSIKRPTRPHDQSLALGQASQVPQIVRLALCERDCDGAGGSQHGLDTLEECREHLLVGQHVSCLVRDARPDVGKHEDTDVKDSPFTVLLQPGGIDAVGHGAATVRHRVDVCLCVRVLCQQRLPVIK